MATKKSKKSSKKAVKKIAKKKTKKVTAKKAQPKKAATLKKAASSPAARPTISGLKVGDAAPNFSLKNQFGETVTLSQFQGQNVVLYFYPKDDTPGCTVEACSFRDNLPHFDGVNAVILGISFDDQESHTKFIQKYDLNFTLLSDTDKSVANDYGVYVEKNMYGNKTMGIERSTFLIDGNGKVFSVFRKVKVDGHTQEVLQALQGTDADTHENLSY